MNRLSSYQTRLLATLFLGLALSGCFDTPAVNPPETPTPALTTPTPTCPQDHRAPGCFPPQPPAVVPSFRVIASGCQAYHHVILVPKGVFNPTYPPGITPPEATDTAGLIVWRCQQAIVGESVVQSFQLGYFAGGISNPDSSQGNASYHRYAFQVYTNSPALAENATRRYGLSFVQAPTVTVKETPLPNGGRLIEYDYPPGMDHYKISGMAHDTSGRGAQTGAFYYANETNLRRFFLFQDSTIASGNDGVLEFGPGSYWANHSSTRHMETAINTYGDAYIEVRFDETFVRPS